MAHLYRYIFRGIGILLFIGALTGLYSALCTIRQHAHPNTQPSHAARR